MAQRFLPILGVLVLLIVSSFSQQPDDHPFDWTLRQRSDLGATGEQQSWDAGRTAFIVCDMWDYHHSVNAVRRLVEFAPRLDAVLAEARQRGATIIHAPSDCMPFYDEHPARKRALAVSSATNAPESVAAWCHRIPGEEKAIYPIDQSNGGEDDDLQEHAQWAAYLESIGRNPGNPWQRQTQMLTIDEATDYIGAEGDVVWNVLEARNISHVILTGVHTNMCVLGRPFGLRQMKRGGKTVALMRDMTDVMYEPNSWPYVSHFSGIDLIIEHIERHVCPTVTSDQVIGGAPFRFRNDRRPTIAVAVSPTWNREQRAFVHQDLRRQFRVDLLDSSASAADVSKADALWLPDQSQLPIDVIKAYAHSGRPIVGVAAGRVAPWFGVNDGSSVTTFNEPIVCSVESDKHPTLQGTDSINVRHALRGEFSGSVQQLIGHDQGSIMWTAVREDSGLSIALPAASDRTSQQLALNALCWATQQPMSDLKTVSISDAWQTFDLMEGLKIASHQDEIIWIRCLVKMSESLTEEVQRLAVPDDPGLSVFINGAALTERDDSGHVMIPQGNLQAEELNVLAIRLTKVQIFKPLLTLRGKHRRELNGKWQFRIGDDPTWANFPIPPQFGAATDYIIDISGD